MNDKILQILLLILSGAVFPAVPFLFYSVYRSRQVPAIWKAIDNLKKDKAEDMDMKMLDGRLRKMEIDFAEKMGRFSGMLDRLEMIEKRFEEIIKGR
jgi:hypothetical protein